MNPSDYPLNDDQRVVIIETIEEVGLENLNMAMVRLLCNADCCNLPASDRETIYRFMHGISLVTNVSIEALEPA